MAAKDLQDLLGDAHQQGAYDSTSEFTVDTKSALSKLGRHQLPAPHFWLAKFIQGANRASATAIDIKLMRSEVLLSIKGEGVPSPETLLGALECPRPSDEHFLVGLRALSQEEGTRFDLESPDSSTLVVSVKGRGSYRGASFLSTPKRTLLAARALEYHLLLSRCWVSAVPISIDGRVLEERFGYPSSAGDPSGPLSGAAVLPISFAGAPLLAFEGRPTLKIVEPSLKDCERVRDHGVWQIYLREQYHANEQFMVGRLMEGNAVGAHVNFGHGKLGFAVHFVLDGVIVDTVLLSHRVPRFQVHHPSGSFQVYAPVESEELDLSGFQVRNREVLAHRYLKSVLEQAIHLCEVFNVHDNRFQLPYNVTKATRKYVERALSLAGGGLGALLGAGAALSVLPAVACAIPFAAAGGMLPRLQNRQTNIMVSWSKPFPMPMKESLLDWQLRLEQQGIQGWPSRPQGPVSLPQNSGWADWPKGSVVRSGMWAVKLVQAGVAAGAENIFLSFSANSFRFKWLGGEPISPEELLSGLSNSQAVGCLAHLLEALRALSDLPIESLNLDLSQANLTWTSEDLKASRSDDVSPDLTLEIKLAATEGGHFLAALKSKTRRYKQLAADALGRVREHCWVSPVPIVLDGRPLDSRFADLPRGRRAAFQGVDHRRLPLCLAHRELSRLPERPPFRRPAVEPLEPTSPKSVKLPGTYLRFPTQHDPGGLLMITSWLRSDSAVEFIHDGALIDLQPLYHPEDMTPPDQRNPLGGLTEGYPKVALRCLVAVRTEELSGSFQVTQPATLARGVLKELEPLLSQTCASIIQALPHLKYSQSNEAKKRDTVTTGILNMRNRRYGVISAPFLKRQLAKGLEELPQLTRCLDPASSSSDLD